MKVIKEYWVTDDDLRNIQRGIIIDKLNYCYDKECKYVNKITISYVVDREITIKESELRSLLKREVTYGTDVFNVMSKLFGDK